MKRIITVILLVNCMLPQVWADFNPIDWELNPIYAELHDSLKGENSVYQKLEIRYDFRYENGDLYMYATEHKIVRILNEESINSFNTYSVSDAKVVKWLTLKARTISKDGKVTEFDENNIKEVKNDESGHAYKIFAVDGIEVGNTVEFLSVKKKSASSFSGNFMQFGSPVLAAKFSLTCPETLRYQLKVYNGYMKEQTQYVQDSICYYAFEGTNIPALYNEPLSNIRTQRVRVEYRLDRNFKRGNYQLYTWDNAAQRIYTNMYDLGLKEAKAFDKYASKLKVAGNTNLEKAKWIEEMIKREFLVKDNNPAQYSDLDFVVKNKMAGDKGLTKLYANLFTYFKIPHQVVLTCKRKSDKFDPDFQSWNYLTDRLIYLTEEKLFLCPSHVLYTIGHIPAQYTAQYALFVRPVTVRAYTSAVADIHYIEPSTSKDNYDHMYINLTINQNEDAVNMNLERSFKGDAGGFFKKALERMDEEHKEKTLKSISAIDGFKPEYKNIEVLPKSEYEKASDATFTFKVDATIPKLLEMAGNKLLLKLGMAIGPQSEMYQEEERKTPVENEFNRSYHREIVFTVPEGYKVTNPDAANMEVYSNESGNAPFGFVSKASYADGVYRVGIDEYYDQIFASLDEFESFRKVINAAANFNKVVLVLEEK